MCPFISDRPTKAFSRRRLSNEFIAFNRFFSHVRFSFLNGNIRSVCPCACESWYTLIVSHGLGGVFCSSTNRRCNAIRQWMYRFYRPNWMPLASLSLLSVLPSSLCLAEFGPQFFFAAFSSIFLSIRRHNRSIYYLAIHFIYALGKSLVSRNASVNSRWWIFNM